VRDGRAERDVRPPFAGCGRAAACPDHATARHDQAQVVPERRDQLLRDRPGRAEPVAERKPLERALQLPPVAAERHLAAPAPEARLDDDGEVELGRLAVMLDQPRLWMRQAGSAERPRREHLVVRPYER
jgi:hypothetical protein